MVPHEVPPVQERAYTRPSSTHAIRCARWHPELAVGGQGRGEDFTPSGRPPMGGCKRPRTTRLDLGASTHNKMVAVRRTRRASIRIGSGLIRSRELSTTYSEDGTHALKMYQQQHQVVRLAHLCRHQRLKVPFVRECAGRFGWNLHGITVSRQYAL